VDTKFIANFVTQHTLAVIATTSPESRPEAAVIGIAVTNDLEIVFDTVKTSRKYVNLMRNPHVALVIGWDYEDTVQYEGEAEELMGSNADKYKEVYFKVFGDEGRKRAAEWPDIVHFKIRPRWIRYSRFTEPRTIEEMTF